MTSKPNPASPSNENADSRHPPAIQWPTAQRQTAFDSWFAAQAQAHQLSPSSLRSASSDASFRRYLRVDRATGGSLIVMDAPPPQEDVRPFVQVAALIGQAGLTAPTVLAQELEQGFLLLTDMGSDLLLPRLQRQRLDGEAAQNEALMRQALHTLVDWQKKVAPGTLPAYDDALLRRELALFPEWCVEKEFGVAWTDDERRQWKEACDLLVASALAQPTVAVHRDYMPRNLMVTPDGGLGLLDFQDAVRGPITYDLASLIRDAFFSWDEEQEIDFAVRYWQVARKAGLPVDEDFGELWRATEWMGLQRHLKVLGIFCRLKHRDAKPRYSEDLPRFFAYAHKAADRYNVLRPLARLLEPLMGATRVEAFY